MLTISFNYCGGLHDQAVDDYGYIRVILLSAGVGRTGTFIAIDAMMERLKSRGDVNVFEFVTEMRTRRMKMVQTLVG